MTLNMNSLDPQLLCTLNTDLLVSTHNYPYMLNERNELLFFVTGLIPYYISTVKSEITMTKGKKPHNSDVLWHKKFNQQCTSITKWRQKTYSSRSWVIWDMWVAIPVLILLHIVFTITWQTTTCLRHWLLFWHGWCWCRPGNKFASLIVQPTLWSLKCWDCVFYNFTQCKYRVIGPM